MSYFHRWTEFMKNRIISAPECKEAVETGVYKTVDSNKDIIIDLNLFGFGEKKWYSHGDRKPNGRCEYASWKDDSGRKFDYSYEFSILTVKSIMQILENQNKC